jgi:septal ring factor EnvC (AmiA/AmiB activator)
VTYIWRKRETDIEHFQQLLEMKADARDVEALRKDLKGTVESMRHDLRGFLEEQKADIKAIERHVTNIRIDQAATKEQLGRYNSNIESEKDQTRDFKVDVMRKLDSLRRTGGRSTDHEGASPDDD